jgi:glycerol-3-phosphate dehydrogenase (NAD(P)+)
VDEKSSYKVAVLGGGSFGTVIANNVAQNGHQVSLWVREESLVAQINANRENSVYLPGYTINRNILATADLLSSVEDCDCVIFAVPSSAFRKTAQRIAGCLSKKTSIISTAKGIESETFLLPSQVLQQELPHCEIGVISGPNIAREIADGQITATVVASENTKFCAQVQDLLVSSNFRVYTNYDKFGVELAGALKNIYAIVAGITDALGVGQNTKGVMLTRSLAEMNRFAVELGANPMTFLGLSGIGDLFVTCTSPLSRNFRIGSSLGNGKSLDEAIKEVGQVAEGINTSRLVKLKADELGIYMPLASALYATLFERRPIRDSLNEMMVSEQSMDVDFMVNIND